MVMMQDSNIKVYYDGIRIAPGPQISIKKTPTYNAGGDNVIGNSFQITLTGHASSYMPALNGGDAPVRPSTGTSHAFWSLDKIQKTLERNSKVLEIKSMCQGGTGETDVVAVGGKLISFDTQEGMWFNYVQYTATLEFSDVSFGNSYNINADSFSINDMNFIDKMYKLKNYNDSWNFTVPENEAFMYYSRVMRMPDELIISREDYSQIQVSYTISATGKNFYNIQNQGISAWEAAKDFVQYKLWSQIATFRAGGLLNGKTFVNTSYNSNTHTAAAGHQDMLMGLDFTPAFPPILDQSIVDRYAVFNEYIDCATSETAGSFTATYNCTLKRSDPQLILLQPTNSVHTFTVSYDQERTPTSQNRTITVNGSLKGMLRTNIIGNIDDGQSFVLPINGIFYAPSSLDAVSAYGNAYEDFVKFIALPDFGDLQENFKKALLINYQSLFPATPLNNSPCIISQGYQHAYQILALPKDFTVTSNYKDGTVEYSASYDTERSCAMERGYNSMTVTEEDAVPLYAEHQVIGRSQGPIMQNLNTNSHKTITISFDGVTQKTCRIQNPWSRGLFEILEPEKYAVLKADVCDTEAYTYLPYTIRMIYWATEKGAIRLGTPLLTKDFSTTYKPSDGTYTVSKTYIVLPNYPTNKPCVLEEEDGSLIGKPDNPN